MVIIMTIKRIQVLKCRVMIKKQKTKQKVESNQNGKSNNSDKYYKYVIKGHCSKHQKKSK